VTLRWIGAIAILGVLAVLVIFYLWRGMVASKAGARGVPSYASMPPNVSCVG